MTNKQNKTTICNHSFCKKCIYEWVQSHCSSCPACRTKLNKYNVAEKYDSSLDSTDGYDSDHEISSHNFINEIRQINTDDTIVQLFISRILFAVDE